MDMKEKNQQWWDMGTRGHMPLEWKLKSQRAGKRPEAARKGRLCQSRDTYKVRLSEWTQLLPCHGHRGVRQEGA